MIQMTGEIQRLIFSRKEIVEKLERELAQGAWEGSTPAPGKGALVFIFSIAALCILEQAISKRKFSSFVYKLSILSACATWTWLWVSHYACLTLCWVKVKGRYFPLNLERHLWWVYVRVRSPPRGALSPRAVWVGEEAQVWVFVNRGTHAAPRCSCSCLRSRPRKGLWGFSFGK